MLFSRKGKLKKEFDERLVATIKETKDEWNNAKVIEELMDDYSLDVISERKKRKAFTFTYLKKHVFVAY